MEEKSLIMRSKLINDWQNKNLKCHFCETTKSVKYSIKISDPVIDNKTTEVYVCNKCILKHNSLIK